MDKVTHEIRLARWKQVIEQCQKRPEGQTAKQWLDDNQVSAKSYYYWLRKIRKEAYNQLEEHISLPAAPEKGTITFAEMPTYSGNTKESPFSFQTAAVIQTSKATVALADTISDHLLERILREFINA